MLKEFIQAIKEQANGIVRDSNNIQGIEVTSGKYFIATLSNADHLVGGASDEFKNQPYINGRTVNNEIRLPVFEVDSRNDIDTGIVFLTIEGYKSIEDLSLRRRFTLPKDHLVFGDPSSPKKWQVIELTDDYKTLAVYEIRGTVYYPMNNYRRNAGLGYFVTYE